MASYDSRADRVQRNEKRRRALPADRRRFDARRYAGESGTKAVRAVFFIDPDAVIRAIIYYPLALGRNFDELRRVLVGLQTIDRFHVSLPADWRPGDEVVIPSPGTMDALDRQEEHPADGVTCHDWFFCTRKLTEEEQQEMAIG